jgi:hypothetical protein
MAFKEQRRIYLEQHEIMGFWCALRFGVLGFLTITETQQVGVTLLQRCLNSRLYYTLLLFNCY